MKEVEAKGRKARRVGERGMGIEEGMGKRGEVITSAIDQHVDGKPQHRHVQLIGGLQFGLCFSKMVFIHCCLNIF